MVYISRIRLRNIKCFADEVAFNLDPASGRKASWTLIIGDNGAGKTTLLRCIALCLCDETRAAGLFAKRLGKFIRNGCEEAEICVTVCHEGNQYSSTTRFSKSREDGTEVLKQEVQPGFPRSDLFVCGYGAAHGSTGSPPVEQYRIMDAVHTLFSYKAPLQNPEFVLHRIISLGEVDKDELLGRIDRLLLLPPESTRLMRSGMEVRGHWGTFVPVADIGDGYSATLAWICDLLGWWYLRGTKKEEDTIQGIVLIDRLEGHLHPTWQRRIVAGLAAEFSGVQFIGTTHAPLTITGAAAEEEPFCKLILLERRRDSAGVTVKSGIRPPLKQRADQVLTSYLFGLDGTSSDFVAKSIQAYARLKAKPRLNPEESRTLKELRVTITDALGGPETELQQIVARALQETLDNAEASRSQDGEAMAFEIKRQVREFLDF